MGRTHTLVTDDILTPAETRIAAGYCEGLIGKEIAEKEHISYHTVVRHTQNIYEKTGIRRTTNALVAWFIARNCRIDMREVLRSVTGFCLFVLVSVQTVLCSGDTYVRVPRGCRAEARVQRTRTRKDNDSTYGYE